MLLKLVINRAYPSMTLLFNNSAFKMPTLFYSTVFCSVLWLATRAECYSNFIKENVTLTIDQGTLVGKKSLDYWNEAFYSFEGIPFAKPPIGELRFKAPKSAGKWSGIYDATKLRPVCPQVLKPFIWIQGMEQNEDCLFVNVHSKMSKKLKPVMVWFYGGGLQWGSIFESKYGPEFLVSEDIVLVKAAYRLNIFGFLKIDDPKYGIHGNAGFKDQVLALKWIQKNIHHFGGDPNQVTIFGESSGGASVNLLCLSPLAKGLFHRAIMQSGSAEDITLVTPKKYTDIIAPLNCTTNKFHKIVKCINQSSTENLINGLEVLEGKVYYNEVLNISELFEFSTVTIERKSRHSFLTETPDRIAKNGNFNKVPILMGFNTDEMAYLATDYFIPPNFTDYRVLIPGDIKIDLASDEAIDLGKKIKEVYYGSQTPSNELIDPFIEYLTDLWILEKMYKYAKLFSKTTPVYFYEFNYYTKLNSKEGTPRKYIYHADELPYLFYQKGATPENMDKNSEEYIAIHRMIKLWTTFAKTGNPNPINDPLLNVKWLPVQLKKFNYLKISQKLELKQNPAEKRMKFWEKIYNY